MHQDGADDNHACSGESGREIASSLLELVNNALETIVAVWQVEDDLVCLLKHVPAPQQDAGTPFYLDAMSARALIHPNDHAELNTVIGRCLSRAMPIVSACLRVRIATGWLPVTAQLRGMAFDDGGPISRIVAMMHPITDPAVLRMLRERDRPQRGIAILPASLSACAHPVSAAADESALSGLLSAHSRVMKMVLHGDDLQAILEEIARMVEHMAPQALCSVLLLSEDGEHFERSAGPSLPTAFHRDILQLTVDPATGSCGAAAYRRETVITADIGSDPLWRDYQGLAQPSGLAACFSKPFFGKSGQVLGTVAMYHRFPGPPETLELQILSAAADLAGVAVSAYIAERRIRDLSSYDALTGLPNRERFRQLLEDELQQARRRGQAAGLLCIDLDRFRLVNESLGQKAGDALLRQAARRLRQVASAADEAARLGADEFVMLVRNPSSLESLARMADELARSLGEPVDIDGRVFRQTASIGFCLFPDDGDDAQSLLRGADLAMSQAKAQGGNTVCRYAAEMLEASIKRLVLRADLTGAAQRGELTLLYQPKLDLSCGRITGAEALVRWSHPQYGSLSPALFIPLAETSGDIMEIGNWVLREACRQMAAWRAAGKPVLPIAVNLSARQFADPGLVANVVAALEQHGLDGELLELEVTESLVIGDPAWAVEVLSTLQATGVRIAVDDFGTGYSSLAQLKRFPVNSVKIDRSFVQDIPGEANDAALVGAIIAMGHALGLRVIAEGVENEAQLDFLQRHDCDAVQGYYLSRPVSAEQLQRLLGQYPVDPLTWHPA